MNPPDHEVVTDGAIGVGRSNVETRPSVGVEPYFAFPCFFRSKVA